MVLYDEERNVTITLEEKPFAISIYDIAKSIKSGSQIMRLLADFVNSYQNTDKRAKEMAEAFAHCHRTLQGLIINLLMKTIIESYSQYSDLRNEEAMRTCLFIKNAYETGKIKDQPFI